jgi:hypothetical protein
MLESYVGTFDRHGLCSLQRESEFPARSLGSVNHNIFWAVIDEAELSEIRKAILLGQRISALEIIFYRAKSLGQLAA